VSGIAGSVRWDGCPGTPGDLERMLLVLARRGPDRAGTWRSDDPGKSPGGGARVELGQTLLATTPEATAEDQPWRHAASGSVIVSDSRLDNRQELAQALGLTTGSADAVGDGALLLAAYDQWGAACVEHLLGDFAFAIWNPRQTRLFVARDVMGVRPLYYHHVEGRLFVFASEPEAILAVGGVPRDLDEGRLADALVVSLEDLDTTSTFYQATRRLPPAHAGVVRADGFTIREYWDPFRRQPFGSHTSDETWIEGLHDQLDQAVADRLRASGRVGSMLSGGLDSSSIVALARRHLATAERGPLPTFSGVSSAPGCEETSAVRRMQAEGGLAQTEIDPDDVPDLLDAVARGWPAEPFDVFMPMVDCLYLTAARRGTRVVLDGIDADGLLSEGDYLNSLAANGQWRPLLREARGLADFHGEPVTPWDVARPAVSQRFVPPVVRRVVNARREPRDFRRLLRHQCIDPAFAARVDLRGRLRARSASVDAGKRARPGDEASTTIRSATTTAGVERYGRAAARQGIEARHPFLDRRLAEYCAWLPMHLRLRDGWPKWALRCAMWRHLPANIAWRRGKADVGWRFNRALLDRLGGLTAADSRLRGFVDLDSVQAWGTDGPMGSSGDRSQDMLVLVGLERWLRSRESSPSAHGQSVGRLATAARIASCSHPVRLEFCR